jgi:nicotinamidase-related amidase
VTSHLVVIDMQRVFADPGGEWSAPRFGEVVPVVADLVTAAKRARKGLTFTRFVAPTKPKGSWAAYYERFPFAQRPADDAMWDVVPEVGADPDRTISLTTFGKWGARLAARADGATVVLTGVSTECCVVATAVAAGASVQVVTDACAGATDASHAAALAVLEYFAPQVVLVTADDVRRSWT